MIDLSIHPHDKNRVVLFPGTGHPLDSVEAEKYSKKKKNFFSFIY